MAGISSNIYSFPVFAKEGIGVFGHIGAEVAGNDGLLARVGDIFKNLLSEVVDFGFELFAFAFHGSEHHVGGCLKVFLIAQVGGVGILAVGFASDGKFELVGEIVERIGHGSHVHHFVVPRLDLCGVLLEHFDKVVVDVAVFLGCILCGSVETLADKRESLEHIV